MKKLALLVLMFGISIPAYLQIQYVKIAPDDSLSMAQSAVSTNGIVLMQSGSKLYGADALTGKKIWFKKLISGGMPGCLTLSNTDGEVYLQILCNAPKQNVRLYTLDAATGIVKDSMTTDEISIKDLYRIPGNDEEVAVNCQKKGTYSLSACTMNKKTGIITKTFFTESKTTGHPQCMAISPDGKTVAVTIYGKNPEIKLYTIADASLIYTIPAKNTDITDLKFSSDGKYLYIPDNVGYLWKLNVSTQQVDKKYKLPANYCSIALSSDGEYAILSGYVQKVIRLNLLTEQIDYSTAYSGVFLATTDDQGKNALVCTNAYYPAYMNKAPHCMLYPFSGIVETNTNTITNSTNSNNATNNNGAFKIGEKVLVEFNGTWYKAVILDFNGDRYKIHYEGYGEDEDEWASPDRIKK